jgi:hypothetical protein
VVFVAKSLSFVEWNAEEIHQVFDFLFVVGRFNIGRRSIFNFLGDFIGIFMAHFKFLEHLIHISLRILIAIVDSLLGELDIPLNLIARNRWDIMIWRDILEDLSLIFFNKIFFLNHLFWVFNLHQTVSMVYYGLTFLANIIVLAVKALISHSNNTIFILTLVTYHSVIYQYLFRFIILEIIDKSLSSSL